MAGEFDLGNPAKSINGRCFGGPRHGEIISTQNRTPGEFIQVPAPQPRRALTPTTELRDAAYEMFMYRLVSFTGGGRVYVFWVPGQVDDAHTVAYVLGLALQAPAP